MHDPYAINATDHISYDKMFRDFDEDKDGLTDIIGYDYNGDWILDGKISI